MNLDPSHPNPNSQQAYQHLIQGEYAQAATLYEQEIAAFGEVMSNYWYLGLALLLQGQEQEAQATWMLAISQGSEEQIDQWLLELFAVLETEAKRRESLADYTLAWVIRQHMRELIPAEVNNLLHLIQLAIELKTFTGKDLTSLGLIEILDSGQPLEVNSELLLNVLQKVLDTPGDDAEVISFVEACVPYIEQTQRLIDILMLAAIKIAYAERRTKLAIQLAEICLKLAPNNSQVLIHLSAFYRQDGRYQESIEIANIYFNSCQTLEDKCFANYLILKSLIDAGGYWKEAPEVFERQKLLFSSLIENNSEGLNPTFASQLLASTSILFYLSDNPKNNRQIQNQLASLCQSSIQTYVNQLKQPSRLDRVNKKLKIGYVSSCLRRHSVGWLARWIFQYYNRERFDFNAYLINQSHLDDFAQEWFVRNASEACSLGFDTLEIANKIVEDGIDILVDLDSMTLDVTCEVMALKPAPIQVTWLGFDASGLPAVDYYIADPYVLPENAQEYYTEKIWRLPQTYVAVDGFEVGIPTLRRELLNIPSDAVVYFSAQNAQKRNYDMARLQMKILKSVPNSYFLIKGSADKAAIENFFGEIAEAEGVEISRLIFLPEVPSELIHRANLAIADIVLDTYPYNGATTTLETLWMGIPLVTRVGEQFASRNSYTMMMNAGVTEGIAWTDEEYIEWGVRLGKEPILRQEIAGKLRQSKRTSRLWNARQFTRDLEAAYEQMRANYMES
ncbi:MAG TPA: O-linked N-acetylglucosamine transferase, SPINDLY family protein [Cyanobacteria bacterium UBA11369]|nr:O-linked N-acetylglucosamine transferase, SPINDLY family protein [Cyanobacteria bacterium UBA11371]HBE30287.1 O-linked N-acetylglucosamine transferase, SPINDLY family protein [Cyanobacteria bacterium UBA11368]HBE49414.1 O-linked N-acetylglucosamine transferase, SPINDLY family protein [Cyanobacteria bacterium UBA11369]